MTFTKQELTTLREALNLLAVHTASADETDKIEQLREIIQYEESELR
jgi:hypothetical protein